MYYVYVLVSCDTRDLYIGLTQNVDRRLKEHNAGYVKSTHSKRPYELLCCEQAPDRTAARKKEKEFKKGYKREYFKSLIRGSSAR